MRARVDSRVRTHVRACEAGAARRGRTARNGGDWVQRVKMGKMATDFDGGGIAYRRNGETAQMVR